MLLTKSLGIWLSPQEIPQGLQFRLTSTGLQDSIPISPSLLLIHRITPKARIEKIGRVDLRPFRAPLLAETFLSQTMSMQSRTYSKYV